MYFENNLNMITNHRESNIKPNEWGIVRKLAMPTLVIRFDIREVETENGIQYKFIEIIGNPGVLDYGSFVSAIINAKYPYDEIESIRNNYLLDGQSNEKHRKEFQEFQEFRDYAKSYVTQIIDKVKHYFN